MTYYVSSGTLNSTNSTNLTQTTILYVLAIIHLEALTVALTDNLISWEIFDTRTSESLDN